MKTPHAVSQRFGRFEIHPARRQLLVDGGPATLGARAFDLLLALLERSDRVVPKAELIDLVWPGLVVEENNLQVQISTLRKMLGPNAIATVPGRGYRFTLPVDRAQAATASTPSQPEASAAAPGAPNAPLRQSNLPARLRPLLGRSTDVLRVRELLAEHCAVSIVGTGGIGKTQLALTVGSELRGQFADGVWWVELATLTDGEQVAAAVARVLGVPSTSSSTPIANVANHLRTQSLLLLLDNCEHVLDVVAELVDAVNRTAPAVRLLVTSQEPLKSPQERVHRLGTLTLPAADGIEAARESGAVQLFVDRALAADPRFTLTADNATVVVEICRRLDGIALALELAAARLPLLGLDGLRTRLDERFHILTGGSRLVLRRHQTLRAALDFSHGLLTPNEQAVFRRIGVFAGSFAVECAQEVAADQAIDDWAVLDHLGALVDKSMVVAEGGSRPRLRLLETARAYALEKLADAGETQQTLRRHAQATAKLFARVYERYWQWSDEELISHCEPEVDNLRAALTWALSNDGELAIALLGDSRPLWLELALQPEGRRFCELALALLGAATPRRAAGRLWHAFATMSANVHPVRTRDAEARAVELLRDADDPGTLAAALMGLALIHEATASQQQLDALDELRRLEQPDWPPRLRMLVPITSARVHRASGRHAEARRDYLAAIDLAVAGQVTQFELATQADLADLAMIVGNLDDAVETYRAVARRLASLHDRLFYMFTLASMATALLLKSDTPAARQALETAAPLIVRYDVGARFASTAALLAAQEERWLAAAQLLGYETAEAAAHGASGAGPGQTRAREQALHLLRGKAHPDDIATWQRSGASLSVDDAYRLALEC